MNYLTWWDTTSVSTTPYKIRNFGTVPRGWHSGQGVHASREIIGDALRFYERATRLGLTETDAFLGTNGEVRLTIYSHSIYLEFTVELNRLVTFVREENGQETDFRENLSIDEALTILDKTGRELWALYASSTTGTTTTVSGVSSPSYLRIRQTDLAYR